MAVGERIKRARNFRGMTQKELGVAIGFEEKSADIRIAQNGLNTSFFETLFLLKFYCCRRLSCAVVHYAVYTLYLINDTVCYLSKYFPRKLRCVSSHEI